MSYLPRTPSKSSTTSTKKSKSSFTNLIPAGVRTNPTIINNSRTKYDAFYKRKTTPFWMLQVSGQLSMATPADQPSTSRSVLFNDQQPQTSRFDEDTKRKFAISSTVSSNKAKRYQQTIVQLSIIQLSPNTIIDFNQIYCSYDEPKGRFASLQQKLTRTY